MTWLRIERHPYENSARKSLAVYMEVATACATTNNDYIMKAATTQGDIHVRETVPQTSPRSAASQR